MADEAYVQIATDGTGKKVRNLSLDVVQPDGTIATVYVQVVAIRDAAGDVVDFTRTNELLEALLREAVLTRRMIARLANDAEGAILADEATLMTPALRR